LFGGFIVGLTSVGSGVFFGLTMLFVFPLRSVKVVGTDVFHAAALLWIAGVAHFAAGNVDISAVAAMLVGSIPGVLIGSSLSVRLPDRALRAALGYVLVLSGVKLIDPPGANVIVLAGLAAMVGVALALCSRSLLRPGQAAAPAAIALRREPVQELAGRPNDERR
jgi:hypothetical protein